MNKEPIIKKCEVCDKDYEIPHRKRSKASQRRFCSKSCSNRSPDVLEKIQRNKLLTYRKKYGVDHPMKTKEVVSNFKSSMKEKYGIEHALQSSIFLQKSKDTKLEKYSDENFNNVEKMKKTCLDKYGVENYVLTDEYKEKTKQTCLEKYNVEFPSQANSYKEKYKNTIFDRFLSSGRFDNFTPLFDIKEYNGVLKNKKYEFKCDRCDQTVLCNLNDGRFPFCFKCDKDDASYGQKEIYDFLKEELGNDVTILTNERTILYPKEIDIYIPSLKLAIEFNGTYWHCELTGNKNKTYHLNKSNKCISKEIRLLHIFEYHWIKNKEIVKSILRNKINVTKNKIYARNCFIKSVDMHDCIEFLDNNHIQGRDKSSFKYGLYYDDELISIMTFCKSRFDKKYEYEMSRFCNKLNLSVIGGSSKLFSYFINNQNPKSIVTYCDRKYFDGSVYSNLGFTFVGHTPPNYYYVNQEHTELFNRMSFQKHRLQKKLFSFDKNLSEWQNMKNNGFDRIWDCGNSKWVWKIN